MRPTDEAIALLKNDPTGWIQENCTLYHRKQGIRIWTANLPYFNVGIYEPGRKISFIEKIRLQNAVNEWHKTASIVVKP